MNVSILTPDSKKHNLAAMKISTYHKSLGDQVVHNFPLIKSDVTYASVLFDYTPDPICDIIGGPKYPGFKLPPEIDAMKPDYSMFNIDYSIGYTYKACPRTCEFCIVPKQQNEETHYSIWSFHDPKFKKICLLNNNTLADPHWRETFQEIKNANLTVVDQNGYDARYITEEVAAEFKGLKLDGYLHTAWDYPEHEAEVLQGLCNLKAVRKSNIMCYVLIGHTTHEENIHRVSVLDAMGVDPFVMPLNKRDPYQKRFARWVNHKAVFKTVRWKDYK